MREGVMPISLEELLRKARNNQRTTELTLDQLQHALKRSNDKEDDAAFKTEMSKRFSNAMAVFTFVLVGIPLAITAQRKETSVGIALSLVVAFSYFIIIVVTDNVKHKPDLHPEFLIWLPNVVYLMLGGTLFFRLARR
jgi:lipopolysaccharide export LptBFGC system permease protein LptF